MAICRATEGNVVTRSVKEPIKPYNTIGKEEVIAAATSIRCGPLSGYLGGGRKGGAKVEELEETWAGLFGVKHAVACNSGTSGLLMACMAAGVGPGDRVITTPFTMSATAAAPAFLGADIDFYDIEGETFCLNPDAAFIATDTKAIVATNLFGHPAQLRTLMELSRNSKTVLGIDVCVIEDNAQGIFAAEYAHYAGTVGHMGVFSLNVHKHLQCGEGGVVTTNSDELAETLRLTRNHSEMAGQRVGLNLRMTEVTAAVALAQLKKREKIMAERIEIAEALTEEVRGLPLITPPAVREGCTHVYYCWAMKIDREREWFVRAMQDEGVPLRAGYIDPLYRLPAFKGFTSRSRCPVAERMHDQELVLYENCAWSPTGSQIKQMGEAFQKVVDRMPHIG